MKKLLILLAFLPLGLGAQTSAGHLNGIGWTLNGAWCTYYDWSEAMAISYLEINNLNTYTPTQRAVIKERLSEPYIVNTFGVKGQNKTVCDFFLFFENSNTSTPLNTRGNTKTGDVLRWNYGSGVYTQNDLPAEINNGVITVTSTDGFSDWTTFDIASNTFIGYIPSLEFHTNALTIFAFTNSSLGGELDVDFSSNTIANFNITNSNMVMNIDEFENTTNIVNFNINDCSGSYGNIKNLNGNPSLTTLYARGTDVHGWLDSITSINDPIIFLQSTNITGYAGLNDIPAAWNNNNIFIEINKWSTPSIDKLLMEMDSSFVSASGELRISSMNQFRTKLSNDAYNSLQSKGTVFNNDSKAFLTDS